MTKEKFDKILSESPYKLLFIINKLETKIAELEIKEGE